MAKGNITGFFEASAANPELAGKVAALASEYGYEFTAEEWSNSAGNIAAKIIRGYICSIKNRLISDEEAEHAFGGTTGIRTRGK